MGKLCLRCAFENSDVAVICTSCGGSFIDSATEKKMPAPILVMKDKSTGKEIKINGCCIIGRLGDIEPEYFANYEKISRRHCEIILENGMYKIKNLPTAKNPTLINGKELPKGMSITIRDGEYLTLADKMFEISICSDILKNEAVQDAPPETNDSAGRKTRYIITCPKCGFEYDVLTIDDRIDECGNCDNYNKYKISKVVAKAVNAN